MLPDELLGVLQGLASDCPQIEGSVLASRDGLLLAASGCLHNETSAASAADLAERIEHNLSLLAATQCREFLVWAQPSVWYLARLGVSCVLMLRAAPDCRPGVLRLAGQNAALQLSALLAPPALNDRAETAGPVPGS